MEKKLYVGNLPYTTNEDELRSVFGEHGEVVSVKVVTDRETGRPRGFAFVEMASGDQAQAAVEALNETVLGGRKILVNEARPQRERGGGGGYGGGGGGGRGRGDRGDRSRW